MWLRVGQISEPLSCFGFDFVGERGEPAERRVSTGGPSRARRQVIRRGDERE